MGPRIIYIPFLLANTILGKPVLSERPLNKFLSVREGIIILKVQRKN